MITSWNFKWCATLTRKCYLIIQFSDVSSFITLYKMRLFKSSNCHASRVVHSFPLSRISQLWHLFARMENGDKCDIGMTNEIRNDYASHWSIAVGFAPFNDCHTHTLTLREPKQVKYIKCWNVVDKKALIKDLPDIYGKRAVITMVIMSLLKSKVSWMILVCMDW